MKLRSKEINVFSMSALDLFASAMGAFMLLAVMALPFFPNTGDSPELVSKVKAELDKAKADAAKAQADAAKAKADAAKAKAEADALKDQIDGMVKFALLGLATSAESFVIVIDMSGSMQSYEDIVLRTVAEILAPLDSANKIQIIGYKGDSGQPPTIRNWQSKGSLISMSPSNKQAANQYVQQLAAGFDNGTPTWAALREALDYPAEAILLLSDGAPNTTDTQQIIRDITQRNGGKKEIHSVAIGDYFSNPKLVEFLRALSRENKGSFVGVAK